jgi:hypothetical protein
MPKNTKKTPKSAGAKLGRKAKKVGTPPGWRLGSGVTKKGKATLVVADDLAVRAATVKGKKRNMKENVARAITKAKNTPFNKGIKFEPRDKFMKRMRAQEAATAPKKPKVPVKRSGSRGGMRGGGLGGRLGGGGMNWSTK